MIHLSPISDYQLIKEIVEHSKSVSEEKRGSLTQYLPKSSEGLPNDLSKLCPISVLNICLIKNSKVTQTVLDIFKKIYLPITPLALEEKTKDRQLSPLHIATISGNQRGVELLVQSGVSLNPLDRFNWTPVHHAALLGRKEILSFLLSRGADEDIRTNRKVTYHKIENLVYPAVSSLDKVIHLFWRNAQGELSLFTKRTYQEKTGALFLEDYKITQLRQFKTWGDVESESNGFLFTDLLRGSYREYLREPLSPILSKVTHDSSGIALPFSLENGLFSQKSILPGQVLGECVGEIRDLPNSIMNKKDLLEDLDFTSYQNEVAQINDGFSNVSLVPLSNEGGVLVRHVLISIEPIREGEQLCLNYNFKHPVKEGPYVELRAKEVKEFIESHDFNYLIDCYGKAQKKTANLQEFFLGERFSYVLDTPPVLFLLTFKGVLSFEKSQKIQALYIEKRIQNSMSVNPLYETLTVTARESRELYGDITDSEYPLTALCYKEFIESVFSKNQFLASINIIVNVNRFVEGCLKGNSGLSDEDFKSLLLAQKGVVS